MIDVKIFKVKLNFLGLVSISLNWKREISCLQNEIGNLLAPPPQIPKDDENSIIRGGM